MKKKKEELPNYVNRNGIIIESKLLEFLGYSKDKQGSVQVSDRIAHFFALYGQDAVTRIQESPSMAVLGLLKRFPADFQALVSLMIVSGARVSEVLSIRCSDISPEGRVRVRGLKRSNDRFIETPSTREYLLYCKKTHIDPFIHYDRFYVYRQLKSMGISQVFGDNKNASVTHLFRHLAILDMQEVDSSLVSAKNTIGHKSIKSTEAYGRKPKK